jgi:hypothetical protein
MEAMMTLSKVLTCAAALAIVTSAPMANAGNRLFSDTLRSGNGTLTSQAASPLRRFVTCSDVCIGKFQKDGSFKGDHWVKSCHNSLTGQWTETPYLPYRSCENF